MMPRLLYGLAAPGRVMLRRDAIVYFFFVLRMLELPHPGCSAELCSHARAGGETNRGFAAPTCQKD